MLFSCHHRGELTQYLFIFTLPMDNVSFQPELDSHSEVDINCLPDKFYAATSNNLTVMNINIRSIKSNFVQLCSFLSLLKYPIKVIVVTESFLDNVTANLYNIPCYKKAMIHRPTLGGGIIAYIHQSLSFDIDKKLTGIYESHESLSFKLSCPDKQVINFTCVYRPPNSHLSDFVKYLESLHTRTINRRSVIVGDLNVCPRRDSSSSAFKSYWDFFVTKGYRQLVKLPTYISYSGNPSILDHIWTNLDHLSECFVFKSPISDHIPVITSFNIETKFPNVHLRYRDFSFKNKTKFFEEIDQEIANLKEHLFSYIHSIDGSFKIVTDWLVAICNLYFPVKQKTVSNRRFKSPWLTTSIIQLIKKKHRLFKLFKKKIIPYKSYSLYCKLLKELLATAESVYHRKRFDDCKFDPKRKWKHINEILGRDRTELLTELEVGGGVNSNPALISHHSNGYYVNVAPNIQKKMPHAPPDFGLNMGENSHELLNDFDPVTVGELSFTISRLKNNSLLSEIPTKFLKICNLKIAPILCHLFNRCLIESHYPNVLKRSTIIPHYKSGNKLKIDNYRPISHLHILNKIFETLIHERLYTYLTSNDIIAKNQFGYMQNRSTTQAALNVVSQVLPAIGRKSFGIILLIDLSKAFDCVQHKLLLAKLHRYGIRDGALRLIQSYLHARKQRVEINHTLSQFMNVTVGVPQGSVLGPLLYIVFSNDLNNIIQDIELTTYADDIALCAVSDSLPDLICLINAKLEIIQNWSCFNRLPINYGKCHAVVVSNKPITNIPNLVIGEYIIPIKGSTNYLGINIDSKLTFKTHLDHVELRLAQLAGISWKTTHKYNINAAISFYYSFVYSLLSYGSPVWGGALLIYSCTRLHSLYRRIVLNLFSWHLPNATFFELCERFSLLAPIEIYKYNLMVLYFNIRNHHFLPNVEFVTSVPSYNFRSWG